MAGTAAAEEEDSRPLTRYHERAIALLEILDGVGMSGGDGGGGGDGDGGDGGGGKVSEGVNEDKEDKEDKEEEHFSTDSDGEQRVVAMLYSRYWDAFIAAVKQVGDEEEDADEATQGLDEYPELLELETVVQRVLNVCVHYGTYRREADKPYHGTVLFHVLRYHPPVEAVAVLCDAGTDVNAQNTVRSTPLHFAGFQGCSAGVVKLLLERGATIRLNNYGSSPLHYACDERCDPAVVDVLLKAGASVHDLEAQQWSPLLRCCRHSGSTAVVRLLLDAGSDVNLIADGGWSALLFALRFRAPLPTVKLLLEAGADPTHATEDNWGAIALLTRYRPTISLCKLMLEAGASASLANSHGWTPLHLAVRHNRSLEYVRLLLDSGADASHVSNGGWSALTFASRYGGDCSLEVIRLLLERGAEPNSLTEGGWSALMLLCRYHACYDCMRALLEAGAHHTTPHPYPPLILLSGYMGQDARCARLLLDAGADVNASSPVGPPLMHAAEGGASVEFVRELIVHGADRRAKGALQVTAAEVAQRHGHTDIHELITRWDEYLCTALLMGVAGAAAGERRNALERMAQSELFDLSLLGVIFGLLDGKTHALDFKERAARARGERG